MRKLNRLLDWDSFEPQLAGLYCDQEYRAYNPALVFKAIVLQSPYDLLQ